MADFSPIVVFVFNRPDHTAKLFESLIRNAEFKDSPLIVYCDQARGDEDVDSVNRTRRIIDEISHTNKTVIKRDENWGLAKSILAGVGEVCNQYGNVIVLEDDLSVSRYFLRYMNAALNYYQNDERVISVSAYTYPIEGSLPKLFFLKGADCWGWATWKRGWDLIETDGNVLLNELANRGLVRKFDFNGSYNYMKMLRNQVRGKNSSWAVRWYASALIKDKLTLYPGMSLVHNIGNDDSGTHCGVESLFDSEVDETQIKLEFDDIEVEESLRSFDLFANFLKNVRRKKAISYVKKCLFMR